MKSARLFHLLCFWRIYAFYFWLWCDFISLKIECVHCEHFVFINLLISYIYALIQSIVGLPLSVSSVAAIWLSSSVAENFQFCPEALRCQTNLFFLLYKTAFPFITPAALTVREFWVVHNIQNVKILKRNTYFMNVSEMHCIERVRASHLSMLKESCVLSCGRCKFCNRFIDEVVIISTTKALNNGNNKNLHKNPKTIKIIYEMHFGIICIIFCFDGTTNSSWKNSNARCMCHARGHVWISKLHFLHAAIASSTMR